MPFLRRLVLAAILATGLSATFGEVARAQTKVKLWGASATVEAYHGFLFLGNPLGFFKEEGVDVEFGTAAGSAATLQLIAAGQVQMGYIGMDVLILARRATRPCRSRPSICRIAATSMRSWCRRRATSRRSPTSRTRISASPISPPAQSRRCAPRSPRPKLNPDTIGRPDPGRQRRASGRGAAREPRAGAVAVPRAACADRDARLQVPLFHPRGAERDHRREHGFPEGAIPTRSRRRCAASPRPRPLRKQTPRQRCGSSGSSSGSRKGSPRKRR